MTEKNSANFELPDDKTVARRPIILLIENDADDLFMCQHAFRRAKLDVDLRVAFSASEGIDWLTGNMPFNHRQLYPVPDIIISDLKTPQLGGLDLLRWARGTVAYAKLPIIIHSGMLQPGDSTVSMKLGATACVEKEASCAKLVEAIRASSAFAELFPAPGECQ